ncbi:MAG: tetratricopeptide repeat protein [Planctomycetes bacterium]|nr:tetratricopeptide repeat protein [Planctomycetota bacterium]
MATTMGPSAGKGKVFFDRADQVAETNNWDFAIELYLQGIEREPENMERGHKLLREVALKRKAAGGKNPSMIEQLKHRPSSKNPVESLVNASHLLAKEPGNPGFMEQVLSAARALNLRALIKWMSDILLEAMKLATKPSRKVLESLIDAYRLVEDYIPAITACEILKKAFPNDLNVDDLMRNLSSMYTIKKGQYDKKDVDFLEKVVNKEAQRDGIEADALVKSDDYLQRQIEKARSDYLASSNVPGKVNAFADALIHKEEDSYENEAIDVLAKAHKELGAYQFKMRIGDIKIRQMTRRLHKLQEQKEKAAADQQYKALRAFELEEYAERVTNYPTDLGIKFELGRRQFEAGKYDEAIASLQQAQRDPRRGVNAAVLLGQAFSRKGWLKEASETFERALQTVDTEEKAKNLRYALGDVLEKQGNLAKAQEQFSLVAQIDFNYQDVRQRLDSLRKKQAGQP